MFKETALTWIAELEKAGKLKEQDTTARDQLADDYARRLEEIFNQEVTRQLEPLGKAAEFERMLLYDSQYTHKYLNQTIDTQLLRLPGGNIQQSQKDYSRRVRGGFRP